DAFGLQAAERILDSARLRAVIVGEEVLAASAHAMRLLCQVHGFEPRGEGAHQIPSLLGRTPAHTGREQSRGGLIAFAPADRKKPVLLHGRKERRAALLAQHLSDQLAERVHILAERLVLRREMDFSAFHSTADKGTALILTRRAARPRRARALRA